MTSDEQPRIPPAAITLGAQDRHAEPGSGRSTITYDAPPTLENMMGYVQGGFIAGMLDSAMGLAVRSVLPEGSTAPTLEMKVSYLRPAELGRLVGHGRVVQLGGTIGFVEGELRGADGDLLATATSTVRIRPPEAR